MSVDLIKFDENSGDDFLDIVMNNENFLNSYVQKKDDLPSIKDLS